jgi:hypothetical protein
MNNDKSGKHLDGELVREACRGHLDLTKIKSLLKQGASPWAIDALGDTALGGLLLYRGDKAVAEAGRRTWIESAIGYRLPADFPDILEQILSRSAISYENQVPARIQVLDEAGVLGEMIEASGRGRVLKLLFPSGRALEDNWRWEVIDLMIKRVPALVIEKIEEAGGSTPQVAAMNYANPAFAVLRALRWPGADVNCWKKAGGGRWLKNRLLFFLNDFGPELLEGGLDARGKGRDGNTLAHHLIINNAYNQSRGALDAFLILIRGGADLKTRNGKGWAVWDKLEKMLASRKEWRDEIAEEMRLLEHKKTLETMVAGGSEGPRMRL